jgi:hypothetical protein
MKRLLSSLAAAVLAVASIPTLAADTAYTAKLTGDAHMPAPIKTDATGDLKLVVSPDGKTISYVLMLEDILNPAAADLHLGPPGANGPLVIKLYPVGDAKPKKGPFSGVLAEGRIDAGDLIGPLAGSPLSDLLEQLAEGNAYVNVHTSDGVDPPNSGPGDYRLGEIRGQIK